MTDSANHCSAAVRPGVTGEPPGSVLLLTGEKAALRKVRKKLLITSKALGSQENNPTPEEGVCVSTTEGGCNAAGESPKTRELINIFINNPWIEELKRKIRQNFELNENKTNIYIAQMQILEKKGLSKCKVHCNIVTNPCPVNIR
jgi:hypothetical protein